MATQTPPTKTEIDSAKTGNTPVLVGGNSAKESKVKAPHDDSRINPVIRIKIGGVATPATPTNPSNNSPVNSVNGSNGSIPLNSANSNNSVNASNPSVGGVTSPATPTAAVISIAQQLAQAGISQAAAKKATTTPSNTTVPTTTPITQAKPPDKPVVTPTELIFDSTKGDVVGVPRVTLSSYQHNTVEVILFDVEQKLAGEIYKRGTIEIEAGFVNGFKHNIFLGDIRGVSRILPDKAKVWGVDKSYKSKTAGTSTATPATPVNIPTITPVTPEVQSALSAGKVKPDKATTPTSGVAEATGTTQVDATIAQPQKLGIVQPGNSKGDAATKEAVAKGAVISVSGNKVTEVSPGQADSSGITISYAANPGLFVVPPEIMKRNNFALQSGAGTTTVKGYNPANKEVIAATIVTPGTPSIHPTGVIQAPEWGAVKLADPIVPGGRFTWAIATRDGSRVPESKAVMQGIVDITGYMIQWEQELGLQFEINSWYRDPASNAAVGGASQSQHLNGCAVDIFFAGMEAFHAKMSDIWEGGVAIKPGEFIHLDTAPGRRRWTY